MGRKCAIGLFLFLGLHNGAAEGAPAQATWSYGVRFAADLSSATVTMRFGRLVPRRLVLSRNDALRAVRFLAGSDGAPPYRANPGRDGVAPRLAKSGDPLRYTVDFRMLAQITRKDRSTQLVGRDLVTRAGLFLLHPADWPRNARVEVRLKLPAGMHAAVPWDRDILRSNEVGETVYLLPSHAMALHARIAFGRFTPKQLPVAGGTIRYQVLDAPRRATDAGIRAYLTTAMGAAVQLFGRPPTPTTDVILQPITPGRGRPIVFGRAALEGGPLLHVMLSGTTTDDAMPGEWITIHEMLHLGMPVTSLADRWFGEGVVSYYQEVVRARAGIITAQQAWQNLNSWMQRGKASGGKRTLAEESRMMTNSYAYHRVYWGGAALALLMDTRIRIATNGQRSLDDVIRYFHANHVTPGRVIDGMTLMRRADTFLGASICEPIARSALASRAFPDLRATYASLGLSVVDKRVVLRNAPHIAHRDAIMRAGGR